MIKFFLAIFAAMVTSFLGLIAVEVLSAFAHPFPEGFSGTKEEMCEHVAKYPHWFLAVVVVLWSGVSALGTWVAKRMAGKNAAIVMSLLLGLGVFTNVLQLPYPLWFEWVIVPSVVAASLVIVFKSAKGSRGVTDPLPVP